MLSHIDAVFTLCPPGDLPGGDARFFDALVSGAVPVVLTQQTEHGRSYWDDNELHHLSADFDHSVAASYPDISFTGLRYNDFLVEIARTSLESQGIIQQLEQLSQPFVMEKWTNLTKVRTLFQYDYTGTVSDAFSVMLRQVEQLVATPRQRGADPAAGSTASLPWNFRYSQRFYNVVDSRGEVRTFELAVSELGAPAPAVIKFCETHWVQEVGRCVKSLLAVLRTDGMYSGPVEYSSLLALQT